MRNWVLHPAASPVSPPMDGVQLHCSGLQLSPYFCSLVKNINHNLNVKMYKIWDYGRIVYSKTYPTFANCTYRTALLVGNKVLVSFFVVRISLIFISDLHLDQPEIKTPLDCLSHLYCRLCALAVLSADPEKRGAVTCQLALGVQMICADTLGCFLPPVHFACPALWSHREVIAAAISATPPAGRENVKCGESAATNNKWISSTAASLSASRKWCVWLTFRFMTASGMIFFCISILMLDFWICIMHPSTAVQKIKLNIWFKNLDYVLILALKSTH